MTTDQTITVPRDVFLAYQKAVALAREETERVKDERDTANAWAGQLSLASDLQRADIGRLRAQLRQASDALRLAENEAEAERAARRTVERFIREWADPEKHSPVGCRECAALFAIARGMYPGDEE